MKPTFRAEGDSFIIENYNQAAPFSSFFPALAGETGKPMWVFYTNRGQSISSFGVNSKDGSMMEFLPANKAYQSTPSVGFRTFIKQAKKADWTEPFSFNNDDVQQTMCVRPYELKLTEINKALGLEIVVRYFGVPYESCPALARSIEIKNISSSANPIQVLDGMPRIVPWGMGDFLVKNMSRTIEAFAEVVNEGTDVPYFKLKVEPDDRPDVRKLKAGFFSFSIGDKGFLPIIVDPSIIFGPDFSFSKPSPIFGTTAISYEGQLRSNVMPSSFFFEEVTLKKNESKIWTSYFGHTETTDEANAFAKKVVESPQYFNTKRTEIKNIYEDLVKKIDFHSSNDKLNAYCRNTFMDNVLRGGYPLSITPNGPLVHIFSRKHGDMERDYNAFEISATYYSQGNGNFRDVNQNRRHDIVLNPSVGSSNVDFFFNLLQLDGFNPLVINPLKFIIPKDLVSHKEFIKTPQFKADYQALRRGPVLPGTLYEFVVNHSADRLNVGNVFTEILTRSIPQQGIQHGDGFWIDHWIYNLDHLDQFVSIYPDQLFWLLYEKNDFTFYDTEYFVRPRKDKYFVTKDGKLRQLDAVVENKSKKVLIQSRSMDGDKVRENNGLGQIFGTNLFTKLVSLAVVKISSLDPFGMGIEMEADKPGWCDALNGGPGLFGSSTHIMFELFKLVKFLREKAIPLAPNRSIEMPHEIIVFMKDVSVALLNVSLTDFRPTWDAMTHARETFRERTFMGVSGKRRAIPVSDIDDFLKRAARVLDLAEKKAVDPETNLPTSYFTHDVDVLKLTGDWKTHMYKMPWVQHRLPPFLEGTVHAMKLSSPADAKKLHQCLKKTELADKKLKMFRLNVSLDKESDELGRIRVFSKGWLENESIFLHMHYKYLLEILRAGLVDEFYKEAKDGLIPFRDMETYGRPIFENSSFIASSTFPKKELHGKGFVARLSGATSEFLSMLYLLVFGKNFFIVENGNILFTPDPSLPGEWFTKKDTDTHLKNTLTLKLFGVPIILLNPKRKNTYGLGAVKPVGFEWISGGRFYVHEGKSLPFEASVALREGRLESLTIFIDKKFNR